MLVGAVNSTFLSNLPTFGFVFVILGLLWYAIFTSNIGKSSSIYNSLLKKSIFALCFGFSVILLIGISSFINATNSDKDDDDVMQNYSSNNGYTINKYLIEMDVSESNSIDVKETITVNFLDDTHHGIYRFIPEWLKYTNKDSKKNSQFDCFF